MSSNNRITLAGANAFLNPNGITIEQDPKLGFYKSSGAIVMSEKTLTKLLTSLFAAAIGKSPK